MKRECCQVASAARRRQGHPGRPASPRASAQPHGAGARRTVGASHGEEPPGGGSSGHPGGPAPSALRGLTAAAPDSVCELNFLIWLCDNSACPVFQMLPGVRHSRNQLPEGLAATCVGWQRPHAQAEPGPARRHPSALAKSRCSYERPFLHSTDEKTEAQRPNAPRAHEALRPGARTRVPRFRFQVPLSLPKGHGAPNSPTAL